MFKQIFIIVIFLAIFVVLYVKYFERCAVYFPTKEIYTTPQQLGLEYEDVFFSAQDGVRLNGWFIAKEAARGTLLFCHGNAGNISHRSDIAKIFHQIKLNVFIFDYRGYGRSQGRPTEIGLYRDAQAAYNYLVKEKAIPAQAIVIYGKSLGANVAVDLASKVQAAALIVDSGFTSAKEMGRKLFPGLVVDWIISIRYDALSKIKEITIPKLIIHSIDDEIVPYKMGRRLFEAAASPKEFYQMRGGHNEALLLATQEYAAKIDEFLNKYFNK